MIKKIVWFPVILFIMAYMALFKNITAPHLVTEAEDLLNIYWGRK